MKWNTGTDRGGGYGRGWERKRMGIKIRSDGVKLFKYYPDSVFS